MHMNTQDHLHMRDEVVMRVRLQRRCIPIYHRRQIRRVRRVRAGTLLVPNLIPTINTTPHTPGRMLCRPRRPMCALIHRLLPSRRLIHRDRLRR